MLRITQQTSAKGAKSYYATADYYSEEQEVVGSWGGKGAEKLGLTGSVDKASFDQLCDNRDPRDGTPLTVRTRSDRTVGYDFTWSCPKSLSLLYAQTADPELLQAFRQAVDETMRDIEAEMQTRDRRGRKDADRVTSNMAWAEFIHTTTRPIDGVPDPQLHAHCFVFNATYDDQESRWKAGQFRDLKRDAPYFQSVMRVRLAGKLQDLGYAIERKRDDFDIAGIPAAVLKRFSRRTAEIEETAAERGITDPKRKGELGALTRENKNHAMTWEALRATWDQRLSPGERAALQAVHRREEAFARPVQGEAVAVDYAIEHSFVRDAVVPERRLLTEALKRGIGSVTVEDVQRELAGRPVIRGEQGGRIMATSQEMLASESRLIAIARQGRGRFRPLGDPDRKCSRGWLNAGQQAAIRHTLGSRDKVSIIRGAAGTGKTTLEQELGEALAEAGHPVIAIAPSTAAVNVLREEAGFAEAATVARFLKDEKMQRSARGGVVLVDEASMLGARDMLHLVDIADGVGARVVLVGDKRQHRSVAAGEPLRLLEQRAGLPVAEVTDILRQQGSYRKAAKALSDGHAAEGFAELDKLGWIREMPDAERYQALAEAYVKATAEKKRGGEKKSALVVSPTHAEAARITAAIRALLKAKGKLKDEHTLNAWIPAQLTEPQKGDAANYEAGDMLQFHQNVPGHGNGSRMVVAEGKPLPLASAEHFEVYRPTRLAVAVGERLRVTANGKSKDGEHKLTNGSLVTVKGFTPQGDLIIDRDWVIARDFGHLAPGYCVTSHSSQGRTVDKVFIGMSSQSLPATNLRSFYVAGTRGKEKAEIFTDDKAALLKAVQRPDEPLSATELARLSRRRPPALRKRLHKHLAFVRRIGNFASIHEARSLHPQPMQPLHREHDHVR